MEGGGGDWNWGGGGQGGGEIRQQQQQQNHGNNSGIPEHIWNIPELAILLFTFFVFSYI